MTAPMCYATDGLIVPAMIPCNGLNAENITSSATAFRTQGGLVRTNASTVATAWTGLGPHYVAPESATLLDVMTPVSTESDVFAGKMESVAGILEDFAAEVDPIQKALEGLKVEAEAFVSDVQSGVWVEPSNPDHPQYSAYISQYSTYGGGSYSGSWNAYGATEPTSFSGTTISWRDHGPSVDRNRELIHAVADQYAKLDAAQVGAANRILALMDNSCGVPLEAVEAWQLKQDGVELPWGTAVEKNRDCGESFGHGMGEAFVGMGEGIGSLFGYNPQTGEWGDGEWAGQAWRGLGMTLAGVATFGPLTLAMRFGPEGTVPRPVRDFITESQDYALNALKGIVAWDTWSENPSEAAGTALVNIGTFFIPGAGTVGGILKAGGAGARVASIAGVVAKGADVVVPGGSFVVKALAEGTLAATLRFGRGLDDMIDVSSLTKADDALHANPGSLLGHTGDDLLGQLDRAGGDAPGGLPGHTTNFELPGGSPVDLPASFDGPGGDVDGAGSPDGSRVGGHVDGAGSPDGSGVGGHVDSGSDSSNTSGAGTSAGTPGRVYTMMDGVDHRAAFAPEQLGPSRVTDVLLQAHGVSRVDYVRLINTPIGSLTAAERGTINSVRDALTAQVTPDTVFQKVMDQPRFVPQPDGSAKVVFGQAERLILEDQTVVTGSVSVADDTAHLATPRDFFYGLRLDYPNTNFSPGDGSAFVLRFQLDGQVPNAIRPQLHSSMGGDGSVDYYSPPFTGNGFLADPTDILPEYRANSVDMRDGAEVWEVLDDGTQRLYAVLRGQEWIPQG